MSGALHCAERGRSVPVVLRAALAAGLWLLASASHAALFDDDEARRQIQELRAQLTASQQAVNDRLGKLDAAVQDKKALVDLALLVESLKSDIAKLRGQNEVLINQTENLERRQRDLYVDLDTRLRKLEQAQAALADKVTGPEREAAKEKEAYEGALNQFRQNNFGAAIAAFQGFMSTYSSSQLVPSAQYWIGNAYYALRDYKSAIAAQQKVLANWADNPKAPDAMLNIASSQGELGDAKSARETLQQLVKKYPTSPAAEQAKQRLVKR
jgi:tol-pal system protein YbgF